MLKLKPYSALFLTLEGFLIMAVGTYFIFFRPPLLPEDLRNIGLSSATIQNVAPNLTVWLQKVFWVMGGYIFTTGLMTAYISQTTFRVRGSGSFSIVVIAGITSIGLMVVVNFLIGSDFRWALSAFAFLWVISLILYRLNK